MDVVKEGAVFIKFFAPVRPPALIACLSMPWNRGSLIMLDDALSNAALKMNFVLSWKGGDLQGGHRRKPVIVLSP